jgi:hypothetical protein
LPSRRPRHRIPKRAETDNLQPINTPSPYPSGTPSRHYRLAGTAKGKYTGLVVEWRRNGLRVGGRKSVRQARRDGKSRTYQFGATLIIIASMIRAYISKDSPPHERPHYAHSSVLPPSTRSLHPARPLIASRGGPIPGPRWVRRRGDHRAKRRLGVRVCGGWLLGTFGSVSE